MRRNTRDILEVLADNIEENIDPKEWEIRIKNMSFFTIKEIEMHWESSRKIPGLSIIVKTLDRGRKFKEERDVVET